MLKLINICRLKVVLGFVTLAVSGCGNQDVKVYSVPKEESRPSVQTAAGPNPHGDNPHLGGGSSLPKLTWTLPDGWKEEATSGIQAAQFSITNPGGTDSRLTVVPLPDLMADEKEIVNLWRDSLSLPPVSDAELPALSEAVDIAGKEAKVYKIASDMGAINVGVVKHAGATWFFKMTGAADHLEPHWEPFQSFLSSIQFSEAPASPSPMAMASANTPSVEGAASGGGHSDWKVPSDWRQTAPGPMLTASYDVNAAAGGSAKVTVSALGGNAGGLLPNINRWCGQMGLPPITEADLGSVVSTIEAGGNQGQLIELNDPKQSQTMLVAMVPAGGRTWFYKILGDSSLVEAQKEPFLDFVNSAVE